MTTTGGWTAGRVAALAAGTVLALVSFGLLAGGAFLAWADLIQSGDGYLTTGTASYSTTGYALTSDPLKLGGDWSWLRWFAGGIRVQVTPADPDRRLFVAIGPASDVTRYLAGTSYATVSAVGGTTVAEHDGPSAPAPPARVVTWAAHATGPATTTLRWTTRSGTWAVLVMNADGSKGVTARVRLAVSSPVLPALATVLLVNSILAGIPAALLIIVPARRAWGRG